MREIKYNFWDTEENKMIKHNSQELILIPVIGGYGADKHFYVSGDDSEISRFDWASAYLIGGRYILLQYTGLKDSKDKEVYEGNIVKFIGGTCDFLPCGIYAAQKHAIGTVLCVQKLSSGFTLCLPSQLGNDIPNMVGKVGNYLFWNHQRSFEIIGNIYENKELLKE